MIKTLVPESVFFVKNILKSTRDVYDFNYRNSYNEIISESYSGLEDYSFFNDNKITRNYSFFSKERSSFFGTGLIRRNIKGCIFIDNGER